MVATTDARPVSTSALEQTIDLVTSNHGTIISINAESSKGRRWLKRHVSGGQDGHVLCEHRYGVDILYGALADGLILQDCQTGLIAHGEPA